MNQFRKLIKVKREAKAKGYLWIADSRKRKLTPSCYCRLVRVYKKTGVYNLELVRDLSYVKVCNDIHTLN